ncbi:MAG TPA: GvpL/GvpF family gas vesicle protein [Methanosarcinales archaeon]|nr:GvpL/GvpF family gas vesicle protein [Methanosarcinales archaeon]
MNAGEQVSGRYIYCIIRSPGERKSFGDIGFGGEEVYTMEYRDFAPVISDAPMKEYEVNEEEVGLHRTVEEHVMKEHSVIPVAYGMVFKNKKLVNVALKAGYKAIKKAMKTVDNRVELGVKVIQPKDASEWNGKIEECRSDFLEGLNKIAADSKELNLFSDRLILNASFLVDRDKIDEFSGELEQIGDRYESLKTQYSGPWAPYNFVDIHILSRPRGGFR